MPTLAIVGATGQLGRCLVRQALDAGYSVTAVVRDGAKAKSLFGSTVSVVEVNIDTGCGLKEAFDRQDAVIEVLPTDVRPRGIATLVAAAEAAGVRTFVAYGTAGILRESTAFDARYVYQSLPRSYHWMATSAHAHLAVTRVAFASTIPVVFQMGAGLLTEGPQSDSLRPLADVFSPDGWSVSFDDFAAVMLSALADAPTYNRKIVGATRAH